ncbi:hypothetical protein [Puerhibacterium sp. TATVAM-FAB25]|uniref:hypothetical protein n=1 Tax=Puerhibacterium sp. TATVAM-FAB25 TaxID=3093699 RepID=UPI00397D2D37
MSVSVVGVVVTLVVVAVVVVALVVALRRRRGEPTEAPRVPAGERPPHPSPERYQTGTGAHGASPWGNVPEGARDNPPGGGW